MTKTNTRATISTVATLAMVASMSPVAAVAAESAAEPVPSDAAGAVEGVIADSELVTLATVEGEFTFDQGEVTPNPVIKNVFQRATKALCGSHVPLAMDDPLGWEITVSGDVDEAFTATVGELAQEESVKKVMTCTCGGNPAGGRATITADVTGIPVEALLAKAGVQKGANAVTFVASDGTEVTLPLGYVIGRHASISYEVNDEDLSASVGGNNQLWMAKTPANYFLRDIVEVVVSTQDEPPANPSEGASHPNSPNIGILAAKA